jgi:methionyl-tRNA formyltransferase
MKIIIVGSFYNKYVHDICMGLKQEGHNVDTILLGSKVQRITFKLDSIRRVYRKHGFIEVIKRLQQKNKLKIKANFLSLSQLIRNIGAKVIYFDYVNSGYVLSALSEDEGKQVVVLAGSGIVDKAFLNCAGECCINGHPSLLPGYRGLDVVEWALSDLAPIGACSHLVSSVVDGGKVLVSKDVKIIVNETYSEFRERVNEIQAQVVVQGVIQMKKGNKTVLDNDFTLSKMCFVAPSLIRKKAIENFKKIQSEL